MFLTHIAPNVYDDLIAVNQKIQLFLNFLCGTSAERTNGAFEHVMFCAAAGAGVNELFAEMGCDVGPQLVACAASAFEFVVYYGYSRFTHIALNVYDGLISVNHRKTIFENNPKSS